MSRRPPIGHGYIEDNDWMHNDAKMFYIKSDGYKQRMPRYYRDKAFSHRDKEKYRLQLQEKFDKEDSQKVEKLLSQGIDPWKMDVAQKEDARRRLNNTIKKGNKL